jgi:hypothetical protein
MRKRTNPVNWAVAALAGGFILLAGIGSFITASKMNQTADSHAMSSGRSGDAPPNVRQDQQATPEAPGASTTTGRHSDSAVPPASR